MRPVRRPLLLLGVLCLMVIAGACGGGGSDAAAEPETLTVPEQESDRCLAVPRDLVEGIATGLTVNGGGTLRNAQAVKSNDLNDAYFISAEIDGPGLEGDGDIGTWAKSGPLAVGGGLILSVDAVANEMSDWGDGRSTDAALSMSDDGADESRACVGG
jgi:hypothetical protein